MRDLICCWKSDVIALLGWLDVVVRFWLCMIPTLVMRREKLGWVLGMHGIEDPSL